MASSGALLSYRASSESLPLTLICRGGSTGRVSAQTAAVHEPPAQLPPHSELGTPSRRGCRMRRPLEHSQRVIPRGSATKDDPCGENRTQRGWSPMQRPQDALWHSWTGSQERVQGWLRLGGAGETRPLLATGKGQRPGWSEDSPEDGVSALAPCQDPAPLSLPLLW